MSHPHPELTLPPVLADGALRIVALGGLGEIGRNMAVLEYAGRLLVIDCGVLFPEDNQPGVDLILPATRTTSAPSRTSCGCAQTSRSWARSSRSRSSRPSSRSTASRR
jgi:hypothetical protein